MWVRVSSEPLSCVDEPPSGQFAVIRHLGLAVSHSPEIEREASPHRLQSLVLVRRVRRDRRGGRYAGDLTGRPYRPVVLPPVGADKLGTLQ